MLGVHQGAELGGLFVGGADDDILHEAGEDRYEVVRYRLFRHDHGQGHATLARAAEGRVHDAARAAFEGRVFEDEGMVLRLGEALNALAVLSGALIDVSSHRRGADEGDAHDIGMPEEYLGLDARAGHYVEYAFG